MNESGVLPSQFFSSSGVFVGGSGLMNFEPFSWVSSEHELAWEKYHHPNTLEESLAAAVLRGDRAAALALVDRIIEERE